MKDVESINKKLGNAKLRHICGREYALFFKVDGDNYRQNLTIYKELLDDTELCLRMLNNTMDKIRNK